MSITSVSPIFLPSSSCAYFSKAAAFNFYSFASLFLLAFVYLGLKGFNDFKGFFVSFFTVLSEINGCLGIIGGGVIGTAEP